MSLLAFLTPMSLVLRPVPLQRDIAPSKLGSSANDGGRCSRAAFLHGALLCPLLLPSLANADDMGDEVMRGVLQRDAQQKPFPDGSIAEVTLRVVGRNTKGPISTVTLPLDGKTFPLEYSIVRSDLREDLPNYIWQADDIYIKADVRTASGKGLAEGRSKAKAVAQADGSTLHQTAYLLLE